MLPTEMTMSTEQQEMVQARLRVWQERVQAARQNDDRHAIVLALTNLALAQFETEDYEAGITVFDEALALAADLDDRTVQVQVLSAQAMAYQDIKRYHTAYEAVTRITRLADELKDTGIKCDALLTEAQILVQSGEPVIALQKLSHARRLAEDLGDRRRQMSVAAVMGNASTASAALDDAAAYIQRAGALAHELGDVPAEAEHLVNLGTVLKWQDRYAEAMEPFKQALSLKGERDLPGIELIALRGLVECYASFGDAERVIEHSERGITLARQQGDHKAAFALLEARALAAFRLENAALAHDTLKDAVALARSIPDADKTLDLLISLGESYRVAGQFDAALDAYRQALNAARQLQRAKDEAYLVGRIGVVYAEQGKSADALRYHNKALDLARRSDLAGLEGEQLCMLALTYLDLNEVDLAEGCCTRAIDVYGRSQDEPGKARAQALLDELKVLG